jgi:hypothetical protein
MRLPRAAPLCHVTPIETMRVQRLNRQRRRTKDKSKSLRFPDLKTNSQ